MSLIEVQVLQGKGNTDYKYKSKRQGEWSCVLTNLTNAVCVGIWVRTKFSNQVRGMNEGKNIDILSFFCQLHDTNNDQSVPQQSHDYSMV